MEDPHAGDRAAANVTPYRGLRTSETTYVEYTTGERELYDLRGDPYQLDNLVTVADPALLERLSTRLAELAGCAGATCQAVENAALDGLAVP